MSDFISELRREVVTAHTTYNRGGRLQRAASLLHPRTWSVTPRAALAAAAIAIVAAAALFIPIYLLIAVRPEPATPPVPKIVTRFSPAGSIVNSTAGFGSVWLDDVNASRLLRVDPRSRRVAAQLLVRGSASLTVGSDGVWVVESTTNAGYDLTGPLLRIDPGTNRVVARIPLRTPAGERFTAWDSFAGHAVLPGHNAVWVLGPRGALRIDTATNRVTTAIALDNKSGYELRDGVLLGGDLWILMQDGGLLRFDARTGARVGVGRAPQGDYLVPLPSALIVVGQRELARIEPSSGAVLWRTRPGGRMGPGTVARGRLWLEASDPGGPGDRLLGIDPQTGKVVSRVHIGEFQANGLTGVGAELWLTTAGGRVVVVRP